MTKHAWRGEIVLLVPSPLPLLYSPLLPHTTPHRTFPSSYGPHPTAPLPWSAGRKKKKKGKRQKEKNKEKTNKRRGKTAKKSRDNNTIKTKRAEGRSQRRPSGKTILPKPRKQGGGEEQYTAHLQNQLYNQNHTPPPKKTRKKNATPQTFILA